MMKTGVQVLDIFCWKPSTKPTWKLAGGLQDVRVAHIAFWLALSCYG